jgi:hypothetical protein
MGSFYRSQHELIFVFRNGRGQHRNNVQLGQFGRNRTNIWEYPGVNTLSKQGDENNLLSLHPTVKPVALVADALLDCSARGEIVLDSFLGSGSTLIAAERVGRVCHGIEIDPLYVDVAIRRWQRHTGDHAIHAVAGKHFDDGADSTPTQYPVGYKKPPSHSRFKPGVSGNAKGRPKGSRNFLTVFDRELNTRIEVSDNGKRRRITKREAIVKQTVNKAAAGDLKATNTLLNEIRYHEIANQPSSACHPELTATADLTVMKNILERIRQSQPPVAEPTQDQEPASEEATTSRPVLTKENSDVI